MDFIGKTKVFPGWLLLAMLCVTSGPVGAVVVAGGDNGWEVSFDGNVNGFWVYEDSDPRPKVTQDIPYRFQNSQIFPPPPIDGGLAPRLTTRQQEQQGGLNINGLISTVAHVALSVLPLLLFLDSPVPDNNCDPADSATANRCHVTLQLSPAFQGGTIGDATRVSRVRTGLLPAFFSFNVRSPEVNGLRGSARISFAPQIQNANTKNQFGAQIDLREVFFNVDGDFGTLSVGRTLSLFQRHNILNDMTLFGVGVQGGAAGGGTTLGRIGYGYVYPQFNARISYKTANVSGFQMEVGMYDPSKICGTGGCATTTKTPRFETEITYASNYDYGSMLGWFGAMWQEAEDFTGAPNSEVTAWGISGGLNVSYGGFGLTAAGYTGEALGSVLMLDTDSLDAVGNERENHGFYVQGTYSLGSLKLGVSYGENNSDLTSEDRRSVAGAMVSERLRSYFENPATDAVPADCRTVDASMATDVFNAMNQISSACAGALEEANFQVPLSVPVHVDKLSSLTFGAYYDVTSWFKLVAEYSRVTNNWHDWIGLRNELEVDSDIFTVGSFFTW